MDTISELDVLVIDDEPQLREEVADLLRFEGLNAFTAESGPEGIKLARQRLPNLIICDVGMPDMSGYEVLEELQKDTATASIPFIFLTAFADKENLRRGMSLGADDYLTKPFVKDDLLSAIQVRLNKLAVRQVEQFRLLAQRLIDYQEVERDNTAAFIHDEIVSALSGLKLVLTSDDMPNSSTLPPLEQAVDIVDTMAEQLHDFEQELRPTMLKQLGLVPTLSWLVQQISNQYDLQIHFTHESMHRVKLHHSIELAAFRVLQEALMNVVQHAKVETVEVKIWAENNLIHIDIVDEGLGFNMAQALSNTRTHGLFTMQERALAVGGTCTVRSRPNDGTVVSVKLPQQIASSQTLALQEMLQAPQMYGQKRYEPANAHAGSVRVIVAEENDLVRQGITRLLEKSGRYAIRAEVQTLHGLRNLVQDMEADLLLFSFTLSESNVAQVLFDLSQTRAQMKIVVLSTQPEAAYAQSSLQNGAKAYILKQSGTATLLNALDRVLDGKEVIDPGVKQSAVRQQQATGTKAESDAYHSLTRREREILFLVLEGLQNTEIADKLVISPRTVETHRSNMMRKLGVRGQAALMRFAVNMGLISAS